MVSFLMGGFAPVVILAILVLGFVFTDHYKKYFRWIEDNWFFRPSLFSVIGFIAFLSALALLLLSTLDLRGRAEKIETSIPDQKTIIIIDSSASMLAEDVRPNRYKKALIMAKHFVKKAMGHQIAIVLFSDIQRRLVPFTDDIDLLDARISGLEDIDISRGGSNITQAVQESIQYFKTTLEEGQNQNGNILIFSDSEETQEGIELNVPEEINVAFVGIGTIRGGRIPIRNREGGFQGYKRYKQKDVISKLNEEYIKSLASKIKNYKYWIASSYTVPTEEVLNFFSTVFIKKLKMIGLATIRPVLSHYIAALGIVFYIVFVILSRFCSFKKVAIFLFFVFSPLFFYGAKGADKSPQKEDPELKEAIERDMALLKSGKLEKKQRLKLAENLLKAEEHEKALHLYDENVDQTIEQIGTLINYGVALFKNGKTVEGMKVYDQIFQSIENDEEVFKQYGGILQNNILTALRENKKKSEGNKGGKGKDKKEDKQKEKKEQDQKEKNENKKGENKQQKEQKQQDKEDGQKKERKKQDPEEALADKEREIRAKRKTVKIPAVIKSLMHKDRKLQKKYFNTQTKQKKRVKKDW